MKYLFLCCGVLAAAVLGGAHWACRSALRVDRARIGSARELSRGLKTGDEQRAYLEAVEALLRAPCEQLTVRSFDGLTLSGRYYAGEVGAPLVIFFHGYRNSAERDGCGAFRLWQERGCGVLLVDQRGHGGSEGQITTLGIRERQDCLSWVNEAVRRFGAQTDILLMGVSMGATTVMMAAGMALPAQVRGIVADCGFTDPKAALCAAMNRRHYPLRLTWPLLYLGARLYCHGLDLCACTAPRALAHASVPVLLIHGEADPIVSCEMAFTLRDACASPVTLLTVPGAGHGTSCFTDGTAYRAAIDRFYRALFSKENCGE